MSNFIITYISVFAIPPSKKEDLQIEEIKGGRLTIDDEVNSIFIKSFNGELQKGLKLQPFHFIFESKERKNITRDALIKFIETNDDIQRDHLSKEFAFNLAKLIDNRTGIQLFVIAFGNNDNSIKIALWAFPHDDPIQLQTVKGSPKIKEISNAFSKSSHLRKACYLVANNKIIGRNDLIKGSLIDSSAGKDKIVADYWLTGFLKGQVEVLSTKGTNDIICYLKTAQKKAMTSDEKNSIKAVFYSLLSGSKNDTTMAEIGNMLVGEAQSAYMKSLPNSIEKDARFIIDKDAVKKKIMNILFILKNGIEVSFPTNLDIDANDYIITDNGKKILQIREEISEEIYK